jgi:hypothetical protein
MRAIAPIGKKDKEAAPRKQQGGTAAAAGLSGKWQACNVRKSFTAYNLAI